MKIIEKEKFTELIADEGKLLFDGEETYSTQVVLGSNDKVENWQEVEDNDGY